MGSETHWDLILRVLGGSCSEEDRDRLNRWLEEDAEHRANFDRLQVIWNTEELSFPKPDTEAALYRVQVRAGLPEMKAAQTGRPHRTASSHYPRRAAVFRFPVVRILKVAAAVLLFLAAATTGTRLFRIHSMREITVANGDRETVTLSDGSRVTLDSGSTLRFPRSFESDGRSVQLTGEAYFEVTPDPDQPFIVHIDHVSITVLGTVFNISTWQRSEGIVVAVIEGKVALRSETPTENLNRVVIEQGQKARMVRNGSPTLPESADIDAIVSWLNDEKHFERSPLREVLDQVERWFDLECILTDTTFAENRVTVFLEKRPVEEILEMLAMVNGFTYERSGKRVTFSSP